MADSFNKKDFVENEFISPIEIKNKEKYYYDLDNILYANSGRIDALDSNLFFIEAGKLISNAIFLFEKGYFDCAFYSLRQSLELSVTTLYLISQKDKHEEWNKQQKIFLNDKMLNYLKEHELDFSDLREKLSDFFDRILETKEKLNKFVHKQGYRTFYSVRNSPIYSTKFSKNKFLEEFEKYLCDCIGAVAIYRLSIAPFPILLSDEEIYRRMFEVMCEPFSYDFLNKYIGHDVIEKYKTTNIYKGYYEQIMENEAQNDAICDIIHNQYIDRGKSTEIKSQIRLLSVSEKFVFEIFCISNKISKVHCSEGLLCYFSDVKSLKTTNHTIGGDSFSKHFESPDTYNYPFYEVYLSFVKILNENYYLEHNTSLSSEEVGQMKELVNKYNQVCEKLTSAIDLLMNSNKTE